MITQRTEAILLFTSYFSKVSDKSQKPLSTKEWNRLVRWLQNYSFNPEDFLSSNHHEVLEKWNDKSISKSRLISLLERKSALAFALDKWTKAGIWIITRGDSAYPIKIKKRLKDDAPPLFFGVGNSNLLNEDYIGIVGSRNTSEEDLSNTSKVVKEISNQGYGIVSGGAKGIDEKSMISILENNGKCVGILADSLITKSTSSSFRSHILNNKLALISPFNPEAGFNVGNAMGRNKLVYTLSDATIVIKSDTKGGTWEGAKENLSNKWVPLWVYNPLIGSLEKGNQEIVKLGGNWLPNLSEINIIEIISKDFINNEKSLKLFENPESKNHNSILPSVKEISLQLFENIKSSNSSNTNKEIISDENVLKFNYNKLTLFELFILNLSKTFKNKFATKPQIVKELDITTKQLDEWLNKGIEKNLIIKSSRPISFMVNPVFTIETFN